MHDDGATAHAHTRAERAPVPEVLTDVAARSAAQMSGENFPVALRLLPRRLRDPLAAVYAFARFVDDVGDEAPGDRLALLDVVAAEVRAEWQAGASTLAPVAGLRPWIDTRALRSEPFLDLVEANRVDQTTSSYRTFADLMNYCRLSAAPVGRIVLRLADADDERNVADSDAVCNALQVLEHCQDVGEDAAAGRVYLPQEDLDSAGVVPSVLRGPTTPAPLRQVIAQQVQRADDMLAAGRPLVRRLRGWTRVAVAGYVAGGEATVAALRAADHDVLSRKVTPSKPRTAALLVARLAGR